MRFDGQVAVVTGGASGIGAACARFFAARGARPVIADRDIEAAALLAREIAATAIELDITDAEAVDQAARAIESGLGAVSILVNSAGILQRPLPPDELETQEWDRVLSVDLRGTYLSCAVFGTRMAKRGHGAIVNIASIAGMRSGPLHAYGPAKAGVINLGECLAAEWGPRGVRVNTVSPGYTLTPALEKGIGKGVVDATAIARHSALLRLVASEEVAAAVAYLASPLASGITGVNLPVDAGHLVAAPWVGLGGLRTS